MGWKLNQKGVLAFSALFLSVPNAMPQEEAGLSIQLGTVTTFYRVDFNHPQLPAGVLRGIDPSAITGEAMQRVETSDVSEGDLILEDANSIETQPPSAPALLYSIDLGEQGMIQVVTAQDSVMPGDCAAIERWDSRTNLRRINPQFCLPENRALTTSLAFEMRSDAKRCFDALDDLIANDSAPLQNNYVHMVCDG